MAKTKARTKAKAKSPLKAKTKAKSSFKGKTKAKPASKPQAKTSPWPSVKRDKDKPTAQPQRSGRYHNPEGGPRDQLVLRNIKALEEYLIHKPEVLLGIEVAPSKAKEVQALCERHGGVFNPAKIRVHDDWPADGDGLAATFRQELGNERDLDDHLAAGARTVLVLDHIKDPRNFGAIARSCAFFGVDAIVIPNKRQVGVTQITLDTAMGAFAKITVFEVPNLTRVLKTLKEAEFWVVGTALSGQSLTPTSLNFPKTALVIGSEDTGISPLIEKTCDLCLRIEGGPDAIDSLNVSVATGIFLQALVAGQSHGIGG